MAEYTFLLGLGISLESGVKGVQAITESLFSEKYFLHTDQSIVKGEHPSEQLRDYYDLSYVQEFLKLLKEKNDEYLHDRFGGKHKTNFEDLYDIVQQISQEAVGTRDNVVIKPFYESVISETVHIRDRFPNFDEPIDIQRLTKITLDLIETSVKYGLNPEKLKGLDVLVDLIGKNSKIDVFTLNHDLLLEHLCDKNNFSIADGFSQKDGQIRWYQPNIWDKNVDMKVYKLHGSRNWCLVRHPKKGQNFAILDGGDKWHNKDANDVPIDLLFDNRRILTGQRKSENYYSGIYGEVHYRFSHHLRTCNNLIVSGYGWNDVQMNWKIFDWLDGNSSNTLILIHKKPEEMAEESRFLQYLDILRRQENGKIILIKKWFQEVGLDDIVDYSSKANS